jgi:dolichol-phosphate mannosyltransferase
MSHKMVEKDVSDFRLLDRKVLDVLKCLKEKNRFMKGLMSWSGFKKCDLYFERPARIKGKTKFNCSKMIRLAFDGIFSFSIMPIRLFTLLGILLSIISFIWIFYIIYQKLYLGDVVSGWASIMSIILFFNGVIMIGLGVLGEYVGRVYNEVKDRPIYVVDQELF